MTANDNSISNDDLHLYADDRLTVDRRREVEAWLAENPEAADLVRKIRAQNEALRAIFEPEFSKGVPDRFHAILDHRRRGPAKTWFMPGPAMRIAASILLLVVGAYGGWLVKTGVVDESSGPIAATGGDPSMTTLAAFLARTDRPFDPDLGTAALGFFRVMVEKHPDMPIYLVGLGRAQLSIGRIERAHRNFRKALAVAPYYSAASEGIERAESLLDKKYQFAWSSYTRGNYEEALGAFSAVDWKAEPVAAIGRGWALLSLGRASDAKAAFRAALDTFPASRRARQGLAAVDRMPESLLAQGWEHAKAGRLDKAARQFSLARARIGEVSAWKIEEGLAWLAYYKGHVDDADRAFRRILANHADAQLARTGRGFVALRRGEFDRAFALLSASLRSRPDQDLASYTTAGKIFLDNRKPEMARRMLEIATRAYPDSADARFLLARAYRELGNAPRALSTALAAARLAPSRISAVYDKLNLPAGNDTNLTAISTMAWALYKIRDNAGAIRRFDQILSIRPTAPEAIRGKGFALYRVGRYKEALPLLEESLKYEPGRLAPIEEVVPIPGTKESWTITYDAHSTRAWAYYKLGRASRATALFREILQRHPDWVDAHAGLGYSLLAMGSREEAKEHFRKALLISPGYPDAHQGVRAVEEL